MEHDILALKQRVLTLKDEVVSDEVRYRLTEMYERLGRPAPLPRKSAHPATETPRTSTPNRGVGGD